MGGDEVLQTMVEALDFTLIQMEGHWRKLTRISERSLGFPVEKRQGMEKYPVTCRSREMIRDSL